MMMMIIIINCLQVTGEPQYVETTWRCDGVHAIAIEVNRKVYLRVSHSNWGQKRGLSRIS